MRKFYGKVELEDQKRWVISTEPHILLRIKRVFEKILKSSAGTVTLSNTPENCRDLKWFLERYPMELTQSDQLVLKAGGKLHEDTILRLEQILDANYHPRRFVMALEPRDYQARAAEIWLSKPDGGLVLGDELGLGKSYSAILGLTDPRTLPTLVVAYPHLQRQWEREINKFAPEMTVHITKTGKPYELPRFNNGKEIDEKDGLFAGEARGPDVLITTYTKLAGWCDVAAKYVKSAIFDEVQELRHNGTAKYEAAEIIRENCRFAIGLTATPIFNYGGEFFNISEIICPGALGRREEFEREWCER